MHLSICFRCLHGYELLKLRRDRTKIPLDSCERVSENHIEGIAATRAVKLGSATVAALATYNGTEVEDPAAIGNGLADLRVPA